MAEDTAFLSEKRRAVVRGEYNGEDATKRSTKSVIRKKAIAAVGELAELAESNEIDNEDVFKPEEIHRLITALTHPSKGVETEENRADWDYAPEMYRAIGQALHGPRFGQTDGGDTDDPS